MIYTCVYNDFKLRVEQIQSTACAMHRRYKVKVIKRPSDVFAKSLLIQNGSILILRSRNKPLYATVHAFNPYIQYNGVVSSGEIVCYDIF